MVSSAILNKNEVYRTLGKHCKPEEERPKLRVLSGLRMPDVEACLKLAEPKACKGGLRVS